MRNVTGFALGLALGLGAGAVLGWVLAAYLHIIASDERAEFRDEVEYP